MSRIRKTIIDQSIDSAEKLVSEKISTEKSDQILSDSLKDLDKLKI